MSPGADPKIMSYKAMKDVGKLYSHLVYFTAISYILWTFGKHIL
jgi:hypothetical protein